MEKAKKNPSIDAQIGALKEELGRVHGRKTEVYSRIVGYYRSVNNWNRGKREEYRYRRTYAYPTSLPAGKTTESALPCKTTSLPRGLDAVVSYQYFYRTTCPNCPPVKSFLAELGLPGSEINVDHDEGFELAGDLAVSATPTVIFRDVEGNELFRSLNLQDLLSAFETKQAVG